MTKMQFRKSIKDELKKRKEPINELFFRRSWWVFEYHIGQTPIQVYDLVKRRG